MFFTVQLKPSAPVRLDRPSLSATPSRAVRIPAGVQPGIPSAAIIFAYIGFDSVSTTPRRPRTPAGQPLAIVISLVPCTFPYIGVVAVLTGMVRFRPAGRQRAGVQYGFQDEGFVAGPKA